jgi:hypothetical protein
MLLQKEKPIWKTNKARKKIRNTNHPKIRTLSCDELNKGDTETNGKETLKIYPTQK